MTDKAHRRRAEFSGPEDWREFTLYLSEVNRFVLSDHWHEFIRDVVRTSNKRAKTLEQGAKLARARIGTDWVEFDDGDEQPFPLSPHRMGSPPKHLATPGRLNSEGIPYLYLSTDMDTAVAEVRPWIGAELTIGTFEVLSDLRIVDTSDDEPQSMLSLYEFVKRDGQIADVRKRAADRYTSADKEKYVWGDINAAFSRPVSPSESPMKYVPTQYLSEKLKTEGYDGIAYRSSLNEGGHNVALFDPQKAKCIGCRMFEVKRLKYHYKECGNPIWPSDDGKVLHQRIEIVGPAHRGNQEDGASTDEDTQQPPERDK
jgi:hypothetical protein